MPNDRLIVGAMSGTSGDGVDVALVRISSSGGNMTAKFLDHHHTPFATEVKSLLFKIRGSGNCQLADFAQLGRDVSLAYVNAVSALLKRANVSATEIACVAAHGQTLYHAPPNTIQYFDPALVAHKIGCPVVSDFRRADCAAGGQGAPLVPFADYILFRHPEKTRVVLNIGGIANLTYLKAGGSLEEVIAFDTGPGNCVSDYVCRQNDPAGPGFDLEGKLAGRVPPIREALHQYLAAEYIRRPGPKSTDGPAMIALFESISTVREAPFHERLATAAAVAVTSIQYAIDTILPGKPDEVIVSGGGTKNATMMAQLRAQNKDRVFTTDQFGIPSDAKEAIAFAILGAATLDGVPANVPSVTGASRRVVLGAITPRP